METSARLFHCARCGRQVRICSRCDRGNRYCGSDCARAARADSVRAAGRTLPGRPAWSPAPCRAPAALAQAARKESDASGFPPFAHT